MMIRGLPDVWGDIDDALRRASRAPTPQLPPAKTVTATRRSLSSSLPLITPSVPTKALVDARVEPDAGGPRRLLQRLFPPAHSVRTVSLGQVARIGARLALVPSARDVGVVQSAHAVPLALDNADMSLQDRADAAGALIWLYGEPRRPVDRWILWHLVDCTRDLFSDLRLLTALLSTRSSGFVELKLAVLQFARAYGVMSGDAAVAAARQLQLLLETCRRQAVEDPRMADPSLLVTALVCLSVVLVFHRALWLQQDAWTSCILDIIERIFSFVEIEAGVRAAFAAMGPGPLTVIANGVRTILTRRVTSAADLTPSVFLLCHLLQIMGDINERRPTPLSEGLFVVPWLAARTGMLTPSYELSTARGKAAGLLSFSRVIDFDSKAVLLRRESAYSMSTAQREAYLYVSRLVDLQRSLLQMPHNPTATVRLTPEKQQHCMNMLFVLDIRRERILMDFIDQLAHKPGNIRKPLKTRFVDSGEEGLDRGGVQKEMMAVAIRQLFDPDTGLFVTDDESQLCWFDPAATSSAWMFFYVGQILGLALYNGIVVDIPLPSFFFSSLLLRSHSHTLDDLAELFPVLARSLKALLDYEGDVERDLCLTFMADDVPLCHGGEERALTNDNRDEFVDLYIAYKLEDEILQMKASLLRGFARIVGDLETLSLFSPADLRRIMCGTSHIDFQQLESVATYDDGYSASHQTIRDFWSIVHSLDEEMQKKLYVFVTASARVPPKGIGVVTFVVHRNGPDSDRLPSSLTCFGRLLLPEYSSKDKLRRMLVTALENYNGFGLV